MTTSILGIDVGKNWFYVVGMDEKGHVTERKKFNRSGITEFIANHPLCTIAMEACASSQYWGRVFQSHGHRVKLLPAQYVVPFRRAQKNDYNDAEAIAEAASRPTMPTVQLRTQEQVDVQALHCARELVVGEYVRLANQIRGLLLENGVAIAKGPQALWKALPKCLDEHTSTLTPALRALVQRLFTRWQSLEKERAELDRDIARIAKEHPFCQRLMSIPGIGPLIATALFAAVGNAAQFRTARDLAAWIGLVPRQFSTGGKTQLFGLTKRGNHYLRKLLVHGARAVARSVGKAHDPLRALVARISARAHVNVAVCALANKIARIAWAVLRHERTYDPKFRPASASFTVASEPT